MSQTHNENCWQEVIVLNLLLSLDFIYILFQK